MGTYPGVRKAVEEEEEKQKKEEEVEKHPFCATDTHTKGSVANYPGVRKATEEEEEIKRAGR